MKQVPFFLLLLFCCPLKGQDDQLFEHWLKYTEGKAVVIAPAGLNLREKPTLRSNVLRSVPFGETVKIIGSKHFGADTVGTVDFYFNASDQLTSIPISGYWLKVSHQGMQGFMFSAYLDKAVNRVSAGDEALNRDYLLLFPEVSCIANYAYYPGWHWYGYYKSETGFFRKEIEVSFYNLIDQEMIAGNTNIVISGSNNKFLQFIIGSRSSLPEKYKTPVYFVGNAGISVYSMNYNDFAIDSILRQCNLRVGLNANDSYNSIEKVILERQGTAQEIGSAEMGLDAAIFSVLWCGDIDGDNKNDYIIHYGEKGSKTILYLSKASEKGQLIKPVAVFYSTYCC